MGRIIYNLGIAGATGLGIIVSLTVAGLWVYGLVADSSDDPPFWWQITSWVVLMFGIGGFVAHQMGWLQ